MMATPKPKVYDYGEDVGRGFEGTSREDFKIPFLRVLQGLSPQLETIAAAKPGMLINTATEEIYDGKKGVAVVPVARRQVYVEWRTRESGGGIVAVHDPDSELVAKTREASESFGKYRTAAGNDLVQTFYLYLVLLLPDGNQRVVLDLTSTKISAYKDLMTRASSVIVNMPDGRQINPPLFAHRFRLTTVKQKNAQGEFYNVQFGWDGPDATSCRLPPDDSVYLEARAYNNFAQQDEMLAITARAQASIKNVVQSKANDPDIPF